jgi:hypothetical protein
MKNLQFYATLDYQNNVITIAYGRKSHGYNGIEIYQSIGESPIRSGEMRRFLRNVIKNLNLTVSIANSQGTAKTTEQLGRQIIKVLGKCNAKVA